MRTLAIFKRIMLQRRGDQNQRGVLLYRNVHIENDCGKRSAWFPSALLRCDRRPEQDVPWQDKPLPLLLHGVR